MTALVAIFVAGTTVGFCRIYWTSRIENALDARDLQWVRIIARRDTAICAAVEAWPDNPHRPMEDFMIDNPEMRAAYDEERDKLGDCG